MGHSVYIIMTMRLCTETANKDGMWLREISPCCCLTSAGKTRELLLNKNLHSFFAISVNRTQQEVPQAKSFNQNWQITAKIHFDLQCHTDSSDFTIRWNSNILWLSTSTRTKLQSVEMQQIPPYKRTFMLWQGREVGEVVCGRNKIHSFGQNRN